MLRDAMKKPDAKVESQILAAVRKAGHVFDAEHISMLCSSPAFYHPAVFAEITDRRESPLRRIGVVWDGREAVTLDGNPETIYRLNDRLPLKLSNDTAGDYLRFFFTFSHGPHGRFLIVENVDDIDWKDDPAPSTRKAISKMVDPLTLLPGSTDENRAFHACIMFRENLMTARIDLSEKGRVKLSEEQILADDMPVIDSVLGQ